MNESKTISRSIFEQIWGKYVAEGGFVQIPNDLIRNQAVLGLDNYDMQVLLYIVSVGSGYASAKKIGEAIGCNHKRIRKSFKNLRERNLVRCIQEDGNAFTYDVQGLIYAVGKLARERKRATLAKKRGYTVIEPTRTHPSHTNEELMNNNIEEGKGYKFFKKQKEKVKNKNPP